MLAAVVQIDSAFDLPTCAGSKLLFKRFVAIPVIARKLLNFHMWKEQQQKRECYECTLYLTDEGRKPLMRLEYPDHLPRSRQHHDTESDVKDLVITL